MTELVPAGVEAALAAFRTGLHSFRMQRDIEPFSAEGSRSWSFIFSLPESEALDILQRFKAEAVSNLISKSGFTYQSNSHSVFPKARNLT